jgi:hypothetical protein
MRKAYRDFSRLNQKVIIDRNGHKKTVYVRIGLPVKKPAESGKVEEKAVQVKYDGEFVLTGSGSRDFGEIKAETGLVEGKIRLRTGKQADERGDYGEKHIERAERLAQLRQNGYANARDFVEDVAKNYEAIYKGRGNGLILTKKGEIRDTTLFVELMPSLEDDFYDVKSGLISKKGYTKNKTPLWVKPQNGV